MQLEQTELSSHLTFLVLLVSLVTIFMTFIDIYRVDNTVIMADIAYEYTFHEVDGLYIVIDEYRGGDSVVAIPPYICNLPVRVIGEGAFERSAITSIAIPFGVEVLELNAFRYCKALKDISLPDSLITICESAIGECTAIKKLVIPDSVTRIDDYAFYNCRSLGYIKLPASVISINGSVVSGCNGLEYIDISQDGLFYSSIDGVLYTKDMASIVKYPEDRRSSGYEIPYGVMTIGQETFRSSNWLQSVSIPDTVQVIGEQSFGECSRLNSINMGNGLLSIGAYAFTQCKELSEIVIPDKVTTIGRGAFTLCRKMMDAYLPRGIISIDSGAFDGCGYAYNEPNDVTSKLVLHGYRGSMVEKYAETWGYLFSER